MPNSNEIRKLLEELQDCCDTINLAAGRLEVSFPDQNDWIDEKACLEILEKDADWACSKENIAIFAKVLWAAIFCFNDRNYLFKEVSKEALSMFDGTMSNHPLEVEKKFGEDLARSIKKFGIEIDEILKRENGSLIK